MLDLFAGTGAAGIEALSRGRRRPPRSWIGRRRRRNAIKRNLVATKLEPRGQVHASAVARFLARDDGPGPPTTW